MPPKKFPKKPQKNQKSKNPKNLKSQKKQNPQKSKRPISKINTQFGLLLYHFSTKVMADMKRLLTSCFGLGYLPIAPGTWGSLPPAVIFVLINYLSYCQSCVITTMALLAIAASIACVVCAPAAIKRTGSKDPGEVVADECAGQAVTFLIIGAVLPEYAFITAIMGFLIFRFFDILKPYPIRKLEKLPQGWGVLADDLLAGVYAGIVLWICYKIGMVEFFSRILSFKN